ncbi:hypothetical protein, partial [Ramlibacter sp.]|uniref:hypothetical protein n=1 Tax=Ramlibacter sp. TaxID=1917967 RepID=UPI0025CB8F6D
AGAALAAASTASAPLTAAAGGAAAATSSWTQRLGQRLSGVFGRAPHSRPGADYPLDPAPAR